MNVTSWNCRGTTSKGSSMMKQNKSAFFILLETHTSGKKARSNIRRIGLKGCCVEETL